MISRDASIWFLAPYMPADNFHFSSLQRWRMKRRGWKTYRRRYFQVPVGPYGEMTSSSLRENMRMEGFWSCNEKLPSSGVDNTPPSSERTCHNGIMWITGWHNINHSCVFTWWRFWGFSTLKRNRGNFSGESFISHTNLFRTFITKDGQCNAFHIS